MDLAMDRKSSLSKEDRVDCTQNYYLEAEYGKRVLHDLNVTADIGDDYR